MIGLTVLQNQTGKTMLLHDISGYLDPPLVAIQDGPTSLGRVEKLRRIQRVLLHVRGLLVRSRFRTGRLPASNAAFAS